MDGNALQGPDPQGGIEEVDESQLRGFGDVDATRKSIFDRTLKAFESRFPMEAGPNLRLEVKDLRYDPKKLEQGIGAAKDAIMQGKRLATPLYGDVSLVDTRTGEIVDERKGHLIAKVPYLSHRGTFIHNGTEYVTVNQSRLRPGVYSRRRENGEIEAHLNIKPGTGAGMRMYMEPQTGIFRLKVGGSQIKLYPILSRLGVSDDDLARAWGPEVLEANRSASDPKAFDRLFDKLVGARAERFLERMRREEAEDASFEPDPGDSEESSAKTAALGDPPELPAERVAFYDAMTRAMALYEPGTPEYDEEMARHGFRAATGPNGEPGYEMVAGKAAALVVPARPDDFSIDREALSAEMDRVDRNPTDAQKSKGNYRMGHVRVQGLDITIENPKGGWRRGTSKDGVKWATRLRNHYGYIRGTKGADGDPVDVFLGPDLDSEMVYVVDQTDGRPGSGFDEHKTMVGWRNRQAAKDAYLANFDEGWNGFWAITPMTMPEFRRWLREADMSVPAHQWAAGSRKSAADEMLGEPIVGEVLRKLAEEAGAPDLPAQDLLGAGDPGPKTPKTPKTPKISDRDRTDLVASQIARMEIDPEISLRTLGNPWSNLGPEPLVAISRKLLAINRGEEKEDDRDDKANQTFHSVDDFMKERILKDAGQVGRTLAHRIRYQGSLKPFRPGLFSSQLESLIQGNSLSQTVPGINPVEIHDLLHKIVQTGEGGIGSMDSIPLEARDVHPSQLGIIDPIRTAESGAVGVDQRLGSFARKGPGNQVYTPVRDLRTGKMVWRTPSQLHGRKTLFPRERRYLAEMAARRAAEGASS